MKKHIRFILLLFVLLFSVTIFMTIINADLQNIDNIKSTLTELGKWAPLAFFLLCIFRSFMLLPCGIFSVAGGVLFGPVIGTLLTLAGFTLNALVMYHMANYFGHDWVKRLLKNKFGYFEEFISRNSFSSFLFLRVVPLLPFDAVSCIAGISKVKTRHFLLATVIGSIPGVFIYTYFGDSLKTMSFEKIILPSTLIILMTFVPVLYKLIKNRYISKKIDKKDSNTTI